ncbi:MAG: malectin domain-containing carbohydrate-binding protein, partial [bacterium]
GIVWFCYPRIQTTYGSHHGDIPYGVKLSLAENILPGMGYFCGDFKGLRIEGTDKPWLFTSGCKGISRYEIPLINDTWGETTGVYKVRLGFMAPPTDQAGQRLFDICLQGKPVLKNLDIAGEAGGSDKALVKEFSGIDVDGGLGRGICLEGVESRS